jgi:hypothetical protein|tara:strand:+ start:148 stop:360 length:213 start_codon:yes stop_codon:yes gene_type:complete
MIATKRKMKRNELIKRVEAMEFVLSKLINSQKNLELIIDYYIEMNKDVKKFEKFLDKKTEDADTSEPKSK